MEIHERIFKLLGDSNDQQKKLAKTTGISQQTISSWKKRGSDPSAKYISAIADFLGVSTSYLLTGKDEINETNIKISEDEQELLNIYKSLDRKGKIKINNLIYDELDRIEQDGDTTTAQ